MEGAANVSVGNVDVPMHSPGFSKPVLFFDCFSAHLLSSPAPTPSTRQTLEALIDTDVGIMNVSRQ